MTLSEATQKAHGKNRFKQETKPLCPKAERTQADGSAAAIEVTKADSGEPLLAARVASTKLPLTCNLASWSARRRWARAGFSTLRKS